MRRTSRDENADWGTANAALRMVERCERKKEKEIDSELLRLSSRSASLEISRAPHSSYQLPLPLLPHSPYHLSSGCKAQYKQTCLVCKSRRSGSAAGRLCGKCQSKKHQGTCTLPFFLSCETAYEEGRVGQRVVLEADGRDGKRTLKLSQDGETQPVFFTNIPVPFRFAVCIYRENGAVELESVEVVSEPQMIGGRIPA
ncbi:hypothetical protein BLNAU_12388 [Blattamonas nauphoetae]|uniref:Uncharacterized protein n=1 Tax=Blattamonas nauphoetae TaxID=2049346 RepID=A0ABQ9XMJ7_9EUKA|nr:hypothetical protein BLNAU_12388 [Blattamonas nauphoetae]